MLPLLLDAGIDKRVIDAYEPDKLFSYGTFADIEPVFLFHNVKNCGYKIYMNNEKIFYATDCGTLDNVSAPGFDYYLVERNYSEADIQERIKTKKEFGEYVYEYSVRRNHLSEEQALAWIAENAKDTSEYVFLHQHTSKESKHDKFGKSSNEV